MRGVNNVKVRIVSTSDIGHGAGISAYRLHRGFINNSINSCMLVCEKKTLDDSVHQIDSGTFISDKHYDIERWLSEYSVQNMYSSNLSHILTNPYFCEADVINLHNIHWHAKNLTPRIFEMIKNEKPIVWTLHDMWPLTGHCIYSYDCQKWLVGCGECPNLDSYMELRVDTTKESMKMKEYLYNKSNFVIVTPSKWLYDIANKSYLFKDKRKYLIPYGVDQSVFFPIKLNKERSVYAHNDETVILFVASHLQDERKGFSFLIDAFRKIKDKFSKAVLFVIGNGNIPDELHNIIRTVQFKDITDAKEMAKIYNFADFLVVPTFADNLPNVVLESLACGTPVIGFKTGGVIDMVQHLRNGLLVESKDSEMLGQAIMIMINNVDLRLKLKENTVLTINKNFTEKMQVERYLELFKEIYQRNCQF